VADGHPDEREDRDDQQDCERFHRGSRRILARRSAGREEGEVEARPATIRAGSSGATTASRRIV
jgi:hypothetical protein